MNSFIRYQAISGTQRQTSLLRCSRYPGSRPNRINIGNAQSSDPWHPNWVMSGHMGRERNWLRCWKSKVVELTCFVPPYYMKYTFFVELQLRSSVCKCIWPYLTNVSGTVPVFVAWRTQICDGIAESALQVCFTSILSLQSALFAE